LVFTNEKLNREVATCLQSLRTEQNMSIEQLSQKSQVPVVHLMSIEEGHFSRFDDFYLKLYLDRYTKILGVSLEQVYTYANKNIAEVVGDEPISVVAEQSESVAPQRIVISQKRNLGKASYKVKGNTKGNLMKGFVFLMLVVLGVAFIFFLIGLFSNLGGSETPEEPPAITNPHEIITESTTAPEETEPTTVPEPDEETTIEPDTHIGRTQTFDVVTSAEELILRIEFEAASWLELRFDGNMVDHGTFNDYLEEAFDLANDEGIIDINFGNLAGVDTITINGVEVEFDGDHTVQRLIFNVVSE